MNRKEFFRGSLHVFLLVSLSGLALAKVALICQILWRTYRILKLVGVITP